MDYQIAVLLTCHNRCEKTVKAIKSLLEASKNFSESKLLLHFFLTDDGCTDGTSDAVRSIVGDIPLTIVRTDGDAYWAGGMRKAWDASLNTKNEFDFFLMINDDVIFDKSAFNELFRTHFYSIDTFGMSGVYTGFIADLNDNGHIIYGAKYYKKSFLSKAYDLQPTGRPQKCMLTNANLLMISKGVFEDIGQLSIDYRHGGADWDYGMRAHYAGFPVLTTCGVCGVGEYDHDSLDMEKLKVLHMSYRERKEFLNKPSKEYQDAFVFLRKYNYPKYILLKMAYGLNLYFPGLYYQLLSLRP